MLRPLLLLHLQVILAVATPLLRGASATQRSSATTPGKHGIIADVTFGWLNPTLTLGASRPLQLADLPELDDTLTTHRAADAFDAEWAAVSATPPPRLAAALNVSDVAVALWRVHGGGFAWAGVLKLACDLCQIASPLLLKYTISLLEQGVGLRAGGKAALLLLSLTVIQVRTPSPTQTRKHAALEPHVLTLSTNPVHNCYRRRLRSATTSPRSFGQGSASARRWSARHTASCFASLPPRASAPPLARSPI